MRALAGKENPRVLGVNVTIDAPLLQRVVGIGVADRLLIKLLQVNGLIAEYLRASDYTLSLSVFLPETGARQAFYACCTCSCAMYAAAMEVLAACRART